MEEDSRYDIDDYIFDFLGNMNEEEVNDYFETLGE